MVKIVLTTAVVVAVAELAKRTSPWAAVLASLPLTSLLAFVWIYLDTGDTARIASMSLDIMWLVIASLPLFIMLSALLRAGWSFWPSLGVACATASFAYVGAAWLLRHLGDA